MGKVRTRILGYEDVEEEQKKQQKERAKQKKAQKYDKSEEAQEKEMMEKVGAEPEEKQTEQKISTKTEEKKEKAVSVRRKKFVRGKKYKKQVKKVEKKKQYPLAEAVSLVKEMSYASFDESVELHINATKTGLKGEVSLPHSTGKTVRVRVVDDALLEELEQGTIAFDVLVSHPSYMPKLAKFAKVLGPKGLMPSPKAGTVSPDPEEVSKKFEKGVLRWKGESKFPLIHQAVGKVSHEPKQLEENVVAFIQEVGKGHIQDAFIASSMGPSVQIDTSEIFA